MKNLLNVDELAAKFEWSRNYIYGLVADREIPYEKVDGRIMFEEDEVCRWIEAQIS